MCYFDIIFLFILHLYTLSIIILAIYSKWSKVFKKGQKKFTFNEEVTTIRE